MESRDSDVDGRARVLTIAEIERIAEIRHVTPRYEHAVNTRHKPTHKHYQRKIDELQATVDKLIEVLGTDQLPIVRPLPKGMISWREFAVQHGIPESTAEWHVNSSHIPVVRGTWRDGKKTLTVILDHEGQRAFYRLFHTHKQFKACEHCPH